jgi:hypothetical protein
LGEPKLNQLELDSIGRHNDEVDSILNKINGDGWREKFERQVVQIFQRDSCLINKLKSKKFIKRKLAIQKKNGNGFVYFVDSALTEDIYRIQVIGYLNDKYGTIGSHCRVIMRYSNKNILSIDDSFIRFSKPIFKKIFVPLSSNKDTIYWYRHIQKTINKFDLKDLKLDKERFHLRIWTQKQIVDLSYNFKDFELATITNFTSSKKTGKQYSYSEIVNEDPIIDLIDSIRLLEIPSQEAIQCWGKINGAPGTRECLDGITYSMEFSTDSTYTFKNYSCPSSWNCTEAATINLFYKRLEEILNLENRFEKFIQTLPKDCYDIGSFYFLCPDSKTKRKFTTKKP